MEDFKLDLLLENYYRMQIITSNYIEDSRGLFDKIADLVNIAPGPELEDVYEVIDFEHTYYNAVSLSDNNVYVRIINFKKNDETLDKKTVNLLLRVLCCKGKAFDELQDSEKKERYIKTTSEVKENIQRGIDSGVIAYLNAAGFLHYHGIVLFHDEKKALNLIEKSAKWNDFFALLMMIKYSKNNEYYRNALGNLIKKNEYGYEYRHEYALDEIVYQDEVALLEKFFAEDKKNRLKYLSFVANIVYSNILSKDSKKNIIASCDMEHQKLMREIDTLPLMHTEPKPFKIDQKALIFNRPKEIRKIENYLNEYKNFDTTTYYNLVIKADSFFMEDYYIDCIRDSNNCSCTTIDAKKLLYIGSEVDPIISAIYESKDLNSIIFVKNFDELNGTELRFIMEYLDIEHMEKYYYSYYRIRMDLSSIRFIFISRKNINSERINYLEIEPLSEDEKKMAIEDLYNRKREKHQRDIPLLPAHLNYLITQRIDTINLVLHMVFIGEIEFSTDDDFFEKALNEINRNDVSLGFLRG